MVWVTFDCPNCKKNTFGCHTGRAKKFGDIIICGSCNARLRVKGTTQLLEVELAVPPSPKGEGIPA
jgi:transcription elongation factor Elf1